MIAVSPYTAGRPMSRGATYRRAGGNYAMRGLGTVSYVKAVPIEGTAGPETLELGSPVSLAVMYARRPLLWLFLLFGGGWAAGYATWTFLGRRKR